MNLLSPEYLAKFLHGQICVLGSYLNITVMCKHVPAATVMCGSHIVATPDLHYFESGYATLILASLPKFLFLAGDFLKTKYGT